MQYGSFAQLYDSLMSDVDYDAWTDYIISLIREHTDGTHVAECACGTGAITIRLKKSGFCVSGFDISEQMLMQASEKARQAGLMIPFVQMDMRELTLHRPHDAVVCACDGVNYLTGRADLGQFFESAYSSLRHGGVLLFDISSEYKLRKILGANIFSHDDDTCTYIWRNMYDDKSHLLEMLLTFFIPCGDGSYTRFDERHVQMAHTEQDIKAALENAGFCDVRAYSFLTRKAAAYDTERIQFTAIRP